MLVIHCESIELVGIFHKWKISHKTRLYLIRLTINTSLLIPKKHCFTLFSGIKLLFFFSLLLTSPNNKVESEMAYNTTATLDKLACADYVDFGKCQERFGQFSWTKNDSNYLDFKLKMFKRKTKCRISIEAKPFNGRS